MNLYFKKHKTLLAGLIACLLAGCATPDDPDNPLRGHLITEIYPDFNTFNLPFYACYNADKFAAEKLPEIKECNKNEDGSFKIIPVNSPGGEKYLIVNRFGRIIEAKGFK